MKNVAVYGSGSRSNVLRKEDLIYGSIDAALDAMPDVSWRHHAMPNLRSGASHPGLREVRPHEKIVALGRAAHNVLADYRKRTLVATSHEDAEALDEDLERLVWSCVNTSKVVALGRDAWRSVQMLPVAERRFFEVPPLRMANAADSAAAVAIGSSILVINHEDDDGRAQQIGHRLSLEGYQVQFTGRGCGEDGDLDLGGWSAPAAIHVHVGNHDGKAAELRLLDSWHSRRFAILLVPRRQEAGRPVESLTINPDVDGFLCDTAEKVLAACADLRDDAVLRGRMLRAGTLNAAPMAQEWLTIAAELVS